jgi:hypothetical protein
MTPAHAQPALHVVINPAFWICRREAPNAWKVFPPAIMDEVLAKLAPIFM